MRLREGLVPLSLAIVLLAVPGCPPRQVVHEPIYDFPEKLDGFGRQFPEAQSASFFRTRILGAGLFEQSDGGYLARFRLNEVWYLAWFDRAGCFTRLHSDDGSVSNLQRPPKEGEQP